MEYVGEIRGQIKDRIRVHRHVSKGIFEIFAFLEMKIIKSWENTGETTLLNVFL